MKETVILNINTRKSAKKIKLTEMHNRKKLQYNHSMVVYYPCAVKLQYCYISKKGSRTSETLIK